LGAFFAAQKTGLSLQFLSPPAAGFRYFRSIPCAIRAAEGCKLDNVEPHSAGKPQFSLYLIFSISAVNLLTISPSSGKSGSLSPAPGTDTG
jgi:hypothetical protein